MHRGKIILAATVAFCLFVSAMIQILTISPGESEILNMRTEILKNQKTIREIEKFVAVNKNLSESINISAEKLDEARKFMPPSISSDIFLAEIYQIAKNEKVDIISVNVGEIEEIEDIENTKVVGQKISIQIESDYISLTNFVREISDGDRLAVLKSFSIEGNNNSGKILSCRAEFEIFAAE